MNLGKARLRFHGVDDGQSGEAQIGKKLPNPALTADWHFRYKRSLQAANDRAAELAILLIAVLDRGLVVFDWRVHRCDLAAIPDRKTLPGGMDKSVPLYQGARRIGNTLHSGGHSVPRDRCLTERLHRICARVSQSPLDENPRSARTASICFCYVDNWNELSSAQWNFMRSVLFT